MDIRRIIFGFLAGAALLLPSAPARAQEVVFDPTQTGVAIENSAQSISEMISMLEQLHKVGAVLDTLWGNGEKIINVAKRFKDAGQLVDLTENYNRLLKQATDYAGRIEEWSDEEYFDGYERMMRYITECISQGGKVIEAYSNFFKLLKTNDAEKQEALQKSIEYIKERIREMQRAYNDTRLQKTFGDGLVSFVTLVEKGSTSQGYAKTYAGLGDEKVMAGGWISLVRIIVAVILVVSVITVFVQTNKGQGGPASLPFIRFFGITVAVYVMLELLNAFI